jgi:hypothetical protein
MRCRSVPQPDLSPGVVSAPLWNSEKSVFAGMFTVSDIIHLIQYYYHHTSSYDNAATDVETFRLESLRGMYPSWPHSHTMAHLRAVFRYRKDPRRSYPTSDS